MGKRGAFMAWGPVRTVNRGVGRSISSAGPHTPALPKRSRSNPTFVFPPEPSNPSCHGNG